ncbi:MAG: ABC transporter permease, partial [Anaerolineaceae bacterium]|nr:ABC transporter permease [Anaerolineaceae bacterium]
LPGHLLGTDQRGQDILSRVIYGARVSLTVGFFGVLLASAIGVTLGLSAGYLGGRVDAILSGAVNLLLSFPYLVLVIIVATVFGRNLLNVILIFGITDAPVFARLVRGEVLRLRGQDYVTAVRGLGAPAWRVMLLHLLPNLVGPLVTLMTFEMSAMIFYEAGLSFLGLSVPPEVPSWGNMLALGRSFLYIYPWMSIYPGLAISLTAFGVNLLGDWVRDVMDPRLRHAD